jgi:hypothetical protein
LGDWWSRIAGCYPTGDEHVPYIRLLKMPSHYIFTLKMATAVFSKMDNFQHSTWLIPESQSCTLNSSHENLRKDESSPHPQKCAIKVRNFLIS